MGFASVDMEGQLYTMPFYIRGLSIWGCWYPWRAPGTNPWWIPRDDGMCQGLWRRLAAVRGALLAQLSAAQSRRHQETAATPRPLSFLPSWLPMCCHGYDVCAQELGAVMTIHLVPFGTAALTGRTSEALTEEYFMKSHTFKWKEEMQYCVFYEGCQNCHLQFPFANCTPETFHSDSSTFCLVKTNQLGTLYQITKPTKSRSELGVGSNKGPGRETTAYRWNFLYKILSMWMN